MPRKPTADHAAPPRALTEDDKAYIQRVREAEADVRQQELHVQAARKQLSEQNAILRKALGNLRACAAALPLFDAG